MKKPSPVVGVTLGDPAGIGPEIVKKAATAVDPRICLRFIGSAQGVTPGHPTQNSAQRAYEALQESVLLFKRGKIQAIVNGPVSKTWLARAGFRFPGQTEFYASRFGLKANAVTMCMVGPRLRVALVSTHVSLSRAVAGLKVQAIVRSGLHLAELLKKLGMRRPRIAVCGLNPHAGEAGMFGKEERIIVAPAIQKLRATLKLPFVGPESADTVFLRALQGEFDGVVVLYHDQGLIPAKLLDFDQTVNVTMGLPVVRCAPDHGTAFGIAGKKKARAGSMLEAIKLASRLLKADR